MYSMKTANAGANKLDAYLARTVDYDVAFDPETGAVRATARVELTNRAPEGRSHQCRGADPRSRPGRAKSTSPAEWSRSIR